MAKGAKTAINEVRAAVTIVGNKVDEALGQPIAEGLDRLVQTTIKASEIQAKEKELQAEAQRAVKMLAIVRGETSNGPLDTRQKSQYEKQFDDVIRELNNLNMERTRVYKEQKGIIQDMKTAASDQSAEQETTKKLKR